MNRSDMRINVFNKLRNYTHQKRASFFFSLLPEKKKETINIVDLGGTVEFWMRWGITEGHNIRITLVNNHKMDKDAVGYDNSVPYIQELVRDVNELEHEDYMAFDIIFSNSMIEHLETRKHQIDVCSRIERSKVPYFIQVPNSRSPIDPHFPSPLVPFFGMYPKSLQAGLLRFSGFGGGRRARSMSHARERVRFYNPINKALFKHLFPSGKLVHESILGVTPSLIMIRGLSGNQ